jgi:hypothetical protein
MSFTRIRTIKGKQYLYRQTSLRVGKKVRSQMEYLGRASACGIPSATWHHPADDRHDPVKLQAEVDARRGEEVPQFDQEQFLAETEKESPQEGG